MTRYYISNPEAERGFEELTEAEWLGLIGEGEGKGDGEELYKSLIEIGANVYTPVTYPIRWKK